MFDKFFLRLGYPQPTERFFNFLNYQLHKKTNENDELWMWKGSKFQIIILIISNPSEPRENNNNRNRNKWR